MGLFGSRHTFILQIVVAVYVAALLSQASRFVEFEFESVNVTSRVDSATYVTGCCYRLTSFIGRHQQVGTRSLLAACSISSE